MRIDKVGPCQITAGDIDRSHNVEIIDGNVMLATLTDEAKLGMEIVVESGVGYQTASMGEENSESVLEQYLWMPRYSPVKRISFQVGNARLGNRVDLGPVSAGYRN